MQTREKVEQVKTKFSAVENPRNPLHEVVKDTKGYRVELGKSSSIASVPADRVQAKQGMGKVPKPIPASPSPRDTLTREFGKALLRMASRQNEVRGQVFYSRKQQTSKSPSVDWWLSHQRPVRVGLHRQAWFDHHPWRQCSHHGISLQLYNGGGGSHPCWIASRDDSQTTYAIILTQSMVWAGLA